MKGKIALSLFILIAGTAGYLLLDPRGTAEREERTSLFVPVPESAPSIQQDSDNNGRLSKEERRIEAMRTEYAELEQARDTVRRQLGKLRSRVWKLHLPVDQARAIREQMQQGYVSLKNPPMLGAFYNAGDIRKETTRVESIGNKLKSMESIVQKYISDQETR